MSCGPMNFMWVIITIVTITHQAHISPIKVMHHPTIIYLQASQPRLLLIHNLLPTSHSPSPSLTLIFSSLSLPTLPTSLVLSCGNYVHIVSFIFWWRWECTCWWWCYHQAMVIQTMQRRDTFVGWWDSGSYPSPIQGWFFAFVSLSVMLFWMCTPCPDIDKLIQWQYSTINKNQTNQQQHGVKCKKMIIKVVNKVIIPI